MLLRRRRKSRHTAGLSFYEEKTTVDFRLLQEIGLWVVYTLIAVFLGVVVTLAFGFRVKISSAAMEPELAQGCIALVDRLSFQMSTPDQGDVIAFYPGGNEEAIPMVRRVAAVSGETVQIEGGILLVDGVPARAGMQMDPILDAGLASDPMKLRDGEYFVIGDNRNNSEDSRSGSLGAVSSSWIIGKVWMALPVKEAHMHVVR